MQRYILALDQGTTSSRAILFGRDGSVGGHAQRPFRQYYPQPGWVEHDPNEIWESERAVAAQALRESGLGRAVAAIGITNQRETTIVWDSDTEEPIYNAIVWQDRRTSDYCGKLKSEGVTEMIRRKTGLIIDAYFSATKIKWILDNVPGARERANKGKLLFGTVDTWLIWRLTRGEVHVTDVSNASRTMLYDIHNLCWDERLLKELDIPASMLPEVHDSSEVYGTCNIQGVKVPIAGIAGDQQAALFGQCCFRPGDAKNTYGTGCFLLMNTGGQAIESRHGLVTTIAIGLGGKVQYALEGSIFVGGAVIQWLRDELGIISSAPEIDVLAATVPDSGGVVVVPAFTGLGAPYWDMYARGAILGVTRGTGRAHIARAVLSCIAAQVTDLMLAMRQDAGCDIALLRADGGASVSDVLLQMQADLLRIPVDRPEMVETTAFGAAALAGLSCGFWRDLEELSTLRRSQRVFLPERPQADCDAYYRLWKRAVGRASDWIEH